MPAELLDQDSRGIRAWLFRVHERLTCRVIRLQKMLRSEERAASNEREQRKHAVGGSNLLRSSTARHEQLSWHLLHIGSVSQRTFHANIIAERP